MDPKRIRSFRSILRRLERVINFQLDECYCCSGVSTAQCHLLLQLEESGPTHLQALADEMRLDKSTVSRTVDGLARMGLVDREPDLDDRRYAVIRLTGRGGAVCGALNRTCDEYYLDVFKAIPQAEHESVIRSLGLLARALASTEAPEKLVTLPDTDDAACEVC